MRGLGKAVQFAAELRECPSRAGDRKSTRLNSSHMSISYAVFCLKKKNVQFVEVDPPRRLVHRDVADFIAGVDAYDVETIVALDETEGGTHVVLNFDAVPDRPLTE